MTNRTVVFLASLTAFTLLIAAGCSNGAGDSASGEGPSNMPPVTVEADDHGHGHPSEGPHHGHLIELGAEEYHAEFVHDEEAGTVTVYILDAAAKQSVPIEAAEIAINLKHDGQGEQFKLAASPVKGDPKGMSSRFVSNDEELGEDLELEDAEAQLVLKIAGKSYRGKIEHDHDHSHKKY